MFNIAGAGPGFSSDHPREGNNSGVHYSHGGGGEGMMAADARSATTVGGVGLSGQSFTGMN